MTLTVITIGKLTVSDKDVFAINHPTKNIMQMYEFRYLSAICYFQKFRSVKYYLDMTKRKNRNTQTKQKDIPSPMAHKMPDKTPGTMAEGKISGLFLL